MRPSDRARLNFAVSASFVTLMTTAGLPIEAAAQEAEPAVSGEIIVTAQRRSERLQDVPVSVGVMSGDTLVEQNLSTLESVSNRTAGLVVRPAAGGDQIAVRGTSSGFNAGFEQSVATFVDGIYRPRARSTWAALFDIERLEVLKGPQTTFFGANAIAGALNITTRKPKAEFGSNVLAYWSPDDDEYKLEGGIDVPVSSDWALRVAGRTNRSDAWAKNSRRNDDGEFKSDQVRVSTRGTLSDRITLDARFDYARTRNRGSLAYEILNCPPTDLPATGLCARSLNLLGQIDTKLDHRYEGAIVDEVSLDLYEGMISSTIELGDANLVLTSGYADQKWTLLQDAVGFPVPSPLGVEPLISPNLQESFSQFSQEIRLQSTSDGPLTYMIGGYFEWGKTVHDFNFGFFQAPIGTFSPNHFQATDLIVATSNATQKSATWSAFTSLSYEPSPQWKLTAGMRYSHVKKTADRVAFIGTIEPFAPGVLPYSVGRVTPGPLAGQQQLAPILGWNLSDFVLGTRSDEQLMPSANITYHLNPDIMTYASFTHGFKAGGYNLFASNDTFGPEKADAYELGIKATWLNRRLTTNVTVFQTDYKDLQESGNIFLDTGAFLPFIGNVAKSRARGIEFEMNTVVSQGFKVSASLTYLDSEFRDYPNAPCSPYEAAFAALPNSTATCPKPNLKGTTRANAPKWSGSVSGDYSSDLSTNLVAGLGTTIYFRSKYFLQTIPEDITSQRAFAKMDVRAFVGDIANAWEVAVIGQNIFDKTTTSFCAHVPTAPGSTQCTAERGRSIGLQFRTNFGTSR